MHDPIPIPTDVASAAAALSTHELVQMVPKHDPASAYRLLVPNGWARVTRLGGIRFEMARPEPVGLFVSSTQHGAPVVSVTQARLPVEIAIEDYVRAQLAHEGWSVFSIRWVEYPSGLRLDVAALPITRCRDQVRRTTAFVDGGRLLMHSAFCPVREWSRLCEALWISAATFELVVPTKSERFEDWTPHEHGGLHCELPATWAVEPKVARDDLAAVDGRLFVDERLAGYVRVKIESHRGAPPNVDKLLAESDHELREAFVTPARNKSDRATVAGRPMPEGWCGGFTCEGNVPGARRVDISYGYKMLDDAVVSIVALCEPLGSDRLGNLRTRRAFEIAAESATRRADGKAETRTES
jgi:hypothetical protein